MTPNLPRRFAWLCCLAALAAPSTAAAQAKLPKPLVSGLKSPECVAVAQDGKIYVSVSGETGKDGDGAVLVLQGDKAVPLADGLDDPKGMAVRAEWLYVADKQRVWRIHRGTKKAQVYLAAEAFPAPPKSLEDLDIDTKGILYVSDSAGVIYRVPPKGKGGAGKPTVLLGAGKGGAIKSPGAIALDGDYALLALDAADGEMHRLIFPGSKLEKLVSGLGVPEGAAFDKFGRLYLADRKGGRILAQVTPEGRPAVLASGFESLGDIAVDYAGRVLVPDRKAGTITALKAQVPGYEVDDSPLPLETAVAFPDLKWTGWQGVTPAGKIEPLKPLVLTHAGDGSNRVFVATQHGVIHVFPNDQKAKQTKVFLDIQKKVRYTNNENEEGLLGMAFHPDFKKNGEFYVFYTPKRKNPKELINHLSRFRVSKDDPDRADPDSEEILLQVKRPFWNHDGGTICFGPDGYLYVALGDGGAANDPYGNGQNLKTLLGSVLRIDVNAKADGKPYAIPKDNPFVGKNDALPEIWAYGLRNVWRMAFDRKTGKLWAADVGQDIYEEINILRSGGNYGWNLREGLHPFGPKATGPRKDLIEPIWEYHHDIGKSITGGSVYRGPRIPELEGMYVYADYVSGKLWALGYDEKQGRAVANRPIRDQARPILSFGEDERGEVYLMTTTPTGRGIYWFVRQQPGK